MKTKQKLVQKVALGLFLIALTFNIGITTQNEDNKDLATISLGTMDVQAQSESTGSNDSEGFSWETFLSGLGEGLADAWTELLDEVNITASETEIILAPGATYTFPNGAVLDNSQGTSNTTFSTSDLQIGSGN